MRIYLPNFSLTLLWTKILLVSYTTNFDGAPPQEEISEGSAREREHQARAFSHARGHLRVSHVLLDGPRKKRNCS